MPALGSHMIVMPTVHQQSFGDIEWVVTCSVADEKNNTSLQIFALTYIYKSIFTTSELLQGHSFTGLLFSYSSDFPG